MLLLQRNNFPCSALTIAGCARVAYLIASQCSGFPLLQHTGSRFFRLVSSVVDVITSKRDLYASTELLKCERAFL